MNRAGTCRVEDELSRHACKILSSVPVVAKKVLDFTVRVSVYLHTTKVTKGFYEAHYVSLLLYVL